MKDFFEAHEASSLLESLDRPWVRAQDLLPIAEQFATALGDYASAVLTKEFGCEPPLYQTGRAHSGRPFNRWTMRTAEQERRWEALVECGWREFRKHAFMANPRPLCRWPQDHGTIADEWHWVAMDEKRWGISIEVHTCTPQLAEMHHHWAALNKRLRQKDRLERQKQMRARRERHISSSAADE